MTQPIAFVTRDFLVDDILDPLAVELTRQGCRVIRGPQQSPPALVQFDRAEWEHFFGNTDLIVTANRTLISKEALQFARRLKGIVYPTVGTESIDLADATELGLIVANGATAQCIFSMSESTVLLILAMLYGLRRSEELMRTGDPFPATRYAHMLRGRTVGLIGMGRIARGVVARLAGWDVNILSSDPFVDQSQAPPGVTMVRLERLLAESDIISVHAPLTAATKGLISRREFTLMKPTAYFINITRGAIVDEAALYDVLDSRLIAGAALDAFCTEPLPRNHPLRTLDNVILTPHVIGRTQELADSLLPAAVANAHDILSGRTPQFVSNPQVLPRWRERLSRLDGSTAPAIT